MVVDCFSRILSYIENIAHRTFVRVEVHRICGLHCCVLIETMNLLLDQNINIANEFLFAGV